MVEEKKKEVQKKEVKKTAMFKLTKLNGSVIEREEVGGVADLYKAKGYKVEEVQK